MNSLNCIATVLARILYLLYCIVFVLLNVELLIIVLVLYWSQKPVLVNPDSFLILYSPSFEILLVIIILVIVRYCCIQIILTHKNVEPRVYQFVLTYVAYSLGCIYRSSALLEEFMSNGLCFQILCILNGQKSCPQCHQTNIIFA